MPRVGHNFSLRHFEIAKPPTYFNQEFWFNLVTFAFFSHAFRQGIIPGVKLRREKTLTFFLLFLHKWKEVLTMKPLISDHSFI